MESIPLVCFRIERVKCKDFDALMFDLKVQKGFKIKLKI